MSGSPPAPPVPPEWARYATAILESIEDAVVLLDPRGRVLSWNRGAERILGWSAGEMAGQQAVRVVPEERTQDLDRVRRELRRQGQISRLDTEARARDGGRIPIRLTAARLDASDGSCAGYTLVLADRREQRELERQVLRADRLATIGLLASSVAHEVGTPLNVILGRAEILAARMREDPEAMRQLTTISSQIQRISEVVARLLTFSREAGPGGSSVDLNAVIGEVAALVEPRARAQKVGIEQQLDPGLRPIVGSPGHFHQVFLNLVMNALDAMPEGGRLQVRSRECAGGGGSLPLGCRCIQVEVQDSGVGIAEADFPHIFEPFFTTKPGTRGTGLGLAITQELVKKYGGGIEVDSRPGHGSRFLVNLPQIPHPSR